jgi:glucuronokinase
MSGPLKHVNGLILDDGPELLAIDTGTASPRSTEAWRTILEGPLAGQRIGKIMCTHMHPDHVGLAGSSAIITACFRALMGFYNVEVPLHTLPTLILSAEKIELNIPAGLQDRVIQVYEGVVFMDFDAALMDRLGHGFYEPLDPSLLPPLYIAYSTDLSEGTEVFHNDMRARYDRGDQQVRAAIQRWANLAEQVKFMLLTHRTRGISALLNENFDLRRSLCPLNPGHIRMIETARSVGVSAKFTGSGGAIVGICEDDTTFSKLVAAMAPLNGRVIRPQILP